MVPKVFWKCQYVLVMYKIHMRCYLLFLGRKISATHIDVLYLHNSMYIYFLIHMYVYIYMYVFIYIYMYGSKQYY